MRYTVTGASGFVGSRLCQSLIARGDQVSAIVVPGSNLDQLRSVLSRIDILEHDGTTESLLPFLDKNKPDVVYHLASLVLGDHSVAHISPLIVSNVLFGTQLLEAMTRCGVRNFINTGSYWQNYRGDESYCPVNLYAATKQAFEDILFYYVDSGLVQSITLKLFDNYGTNDPRPKLLNLLKDAAFSGISLDMSAGEQYIDLVHVNDVVNAYFCAASRLTSQTLPAQEIYSVSSGNPTQLRALVELTSRIWKKSIPINWGRRPYRPREIMKPPNIGVTPPGWQPLVKLEQGLAELLESSTTLPT